MAGKSVLKRGFKAQAERIAEQYRLEMGYSVHEPLDAFELAEHLEIPILNIQTLKELPRQYLKTLSSVSKFNAVWLPNVTGQKVIVHNSAHSPKRQQSNLMHELAHIILKHEIPDEQAKLCKEFGLHYYNPLHEEEAKYLGGCLQITRQGLLWTLKQNFNEEEICDYYTASMDMVNYRLNTSGVRIQLSYRKQF